ncbi:putative membrane transport protein [Yersinia thracica]|uniref:Putative membrane transport protein n=1 Tax=Yersinia thracica TaxID=2890319 RepID=A0A0T9QL01_9GAMM|nr:DASS family sodium-coupled anion symporter [Yersinia thracica]CNI16989.1 putative membrane transport protein [Yersinia thracica]
MSILKTRIGRMLLILLIGISIWFSPVPESIDPRAWHLMAVFAATVIGLIISPYPLGALAIFSLTVVAATGLLSIKEVLAGFADPIIWMIACAFFISRSFIKTGFSRRVGYLFISKLGHSSLGLAYGLILTDLLFAPAMPSTAARCGGIITPLFRSISDVYESNPEQSTERKIGAFLVQCIVQCDAIICAMFLTSMAGNPMIGKLAGEMGITITWVSWALAAIVPGLLSLTIIPLLLYRFYPPELKKTPEMRTLALVKLKEMGPMSWFGASIAGSVQGMNWLPMMGILLLAYYYSHYMMASAIAHISAMYTIFVSITIAAGAPPMLTGLVFGMFSNLYMATTHYSGGPAAILFGCNFIPLTTWWKIGFLISLVVIPIWLIIGSAWWSVLGFW